jgi:hypothetical protein
MLRRKQASNPLLSHEMTARGYRSRGCRWSHLQVCSQVCSLGMCSCWRKPSVVEPAAGG